MKNFLLTLGACCLVLLGVGINFNQAEAKPLKAGTFDAKFLDQMTAHHRDAVDMAKLAQDKAQNSELKEMSQKMAKDQTEEIQQMKDWRERLYPSIPQFSRKMAKMDMNDLSKKNGREFDLAFIDMMSKHHEEGINMAKKASDRLFNPQIKDFAQNVIFAQDRERSQMNQIKKSEVSQSGMSR